MGRRTVPWAREDEKDMDGEDRALLLLPALDQFLKGVICSFILAGLFE